MFDLQMIESLVFLAVITAAIVGYGVVLGRKEDRDTGHEVDSGNYKKTA